jgi:hypothetical protein
MGSKNREIQSKSVVSKTEGRVVRVVQEFIIKLGRSKAEVKKPTRSPVGSTIRFRSGADEPEAEVIISEHVDAKSQKIAGRHGG